MNLQVAQKLADEVRRRGGDEAAIESVFTAYVQQRSDECPLALMHFFGTFRAQCSPAEQKKHGVYFTPPGLAAYVTRCARSLAAQCGSGAPVWLDPACGAGVFLHTARQQLAGSTPAPAAVTGIELLAGSAAVARCLLNDHAASDINVSVLNANALLEPAETLAPLLLQGGPLVVTGNPPYSSRSAQHDHPAVAAMLAEYRQGVDQRKVNLTDDFIQFIRWSQLWIERAGSGVLAMVTSSTYLDGLTHHAMRRSLLGTFDQIYVLNLHGNVLRRETAAPASEGCRDENIFGVRSGIAAGLFVRKDAARRTACTPTVMHASLRGSKQQKLAALASLNLEDTPWQAAAPQPPAYTFTPQQPSSSEYDNWLPLNEVFAHYISGVQTKNDALLTAISRQELTQRLAAQFDDFDPAHIRPYLMAPFDVRFVYYDRRRIGRPRWPVAQHLLAGGGGLLFMRQSRGEAEYNHFLATPHLASDRAFYSAHGAPYMAPLMLHEEAGMAPNATPALLAMLARRPATQPLAGNPLLMWRQFVCWMYAIFHSRKFRRRYHAQLSAGFPRTPLPTSAEQFGVFVNHGAALWRLHIAAQQAPPAEEAAEAALQIELHELWSQIQGDAWEHRTGGYPVLPRWIKQREGRLVTQPVMARVRTIAAALEETTRIQQEIDAGMAPFVS